MSLLVTQFTNDMHTLDTETDRLNAHYKYVFEQPTNCQQLEECERQFGNTLFWKQN